MRTPCEVRPLRARSCCPRTRGTSRAGSRPPDSRQPLLAALAVPLASERASVAGSFVGNAEGRRNPVFTVGHSTRPVEELITLLGGVAADIIADVRAFP